MQQNQFLQLKKQSTFLFIILTIFTLGIYAAHYVKEQSVKIDKLPHGLSNIGSAYTGTLLGLSYISLFTWLICTFAPESDELLPLYLVDSLLNFSISIMFLIWGFMARKRVNAAFNFEAGTSYWFHGFWTFVFSPTYFNYKVNCVCELYEAYEEGKTHTSDVSDMEA